ncbi:MAG: putative sulfate exporter family transporter [Acidaminobacteraceae bacterium]
MKKIKDLFPGLILIIIISLLSKQISFMLKDYVTLESLTIAIIIGMLVNNTLGVKKVFSGGITYSLKTLLKVGIVLLGFKLSADAILNLGFTTIIMVVAYVFIILFLSIKIGTKMHVPKKLATLIGVGSSICGASAVVALAPSIGADDDEAIIAVSIVSFLGAIGVIVYSLVPKFIPSITHIQFGIWSGLTLHGVAHALAGAFSMGEVSGEIGTFVKMTRVLMLVPVSIILGLMFGEKGETSESKTAKFPMYVALFIVAVIVNSVIRLPLGLSSILKQLSSFFILIAMTAMGLKVDLSSIKSKGMSSLLLGSLVFLIGSISAYIIIQVVI